MTTNPRLAHGLLVPLVVACLVTSPVCVAATRPSIADLQARIAALEDSSIAELDGYLALDTSNPATPVARFSGVNVQIVNGTGRTDLANGAGNLVVGYNERRSTAPGFTEECALPLVPGMIENEANCVASGYVWALDHRGGSHNVVVGNYQNYPTVAGLVAGQASSIRGGWGVVSGGFMNRVDAAFSSVSGGRNNVTLNFAASISGGSYNRATHQFASVAGGSNNTASGKNSSVSGGHSGTASGEDSSVTGGLGNTASGLYSSVSGGGNQQASGVGATATGGFGNQAVGSYSSISGGASHAVLNTYDWLAGGYHWP